MDSYLIHRDHKYVDKYKSKSGRWIYVYAQNSMKNKPELMLNSKRQKGQNSSGLGNVISGTGTLVGAGESKPSYNRPAGRQKNVLEGTAKVEKGNKVYTASRPVGREKEVLEGTATPKKKESVSTAMQNANQALKEKVKAQQIQAERDKHELAQQREWAQKNIFQKGIAKAKLASQSLRVKIDQGKKALQVIFGKS